MNSRIVLALALAGALAAPMAPAQTCNPSIRASAPDSRFVVNAAKGTVLDQRTGLTWKRCVEGQSGANCGLGSAAYLNWGAALRRAEASAFAGYKDWRVPNSKELESLVEVQCDSPAINLSVFPNDPSTWVWASSPYANYAYNAWSVNFSYGGSYYFGSRYNDNTVRLVRGGQ
jgi:hypothetical protein